MLEGWKKGGFVCSYLLPGLDEDASESSEQDLVLGDFEAVGVGGFAESALLLEVSTDLVEFIGDLGIIGGSANETGQSRGSVGIASTLNQPARRLKRG